jgi:hypothetical protein
MVVRKKEPNDVAKVAEPTVQKLDCLIVISRATTYHPLYKVTGVCSSEAFLNSAAHLTFASIRHYPFRHSPSLCIKSGCTAQSPFITSPSDKLTVPRGSPEGFRNIN